MAAYDATPPSVPGGPNAPPDQRVTVADVPTDVRSAALTIIAVLLSIAALYFAQSLLVPIVLGIGASYALEPPVEMLVRWRIPRAAAAGLVVLALTAGLGWMAYELADQANAVVDNLPKAAQKLREMVTRTTASTDSVAKIQKAADELHKAAEAPGVAAPPHRPGIARVEVVTPGVSVRDYLVWGSLGVAAALGQLLLILFLAFFLLASGDLYKRKLVKLTGPSLSHKKITVQILDEINSQVSHFLFHLMLTNVIVGVVSALAFWWLGLEQAGLWGLAAGVLNTIPYVGPLVAMVATSVAAIVQTGSLETTLWVAGAGLAITSLEGFLLTPWLMSRAAQMNAAAVFVGLLFWGWVWGLWGMLLAVPLLMVIKTVADRVDDLRPVGDLLGE